MPSSNYFPKSQAGMIEIDRVAGDALQKYLVADYLDGYFNEAEQWAYEHLIKAGGYAPPGLSKSGFRA